MGGACSSDKAVAAEVAKPLPSVAAADEEPAAGLSIVDEKQTDETQAGEKQEERDVNRRHNALNRCFDSLDKDRSGSLDLKEVKQYLFRTGISMNNLPDDATALMAKLDVNNDHLISREEFVLMVEVLTIERNDDALDSWVAEIIYTANSKNVTGFGNVLGDTVATLDLTKEHMELIKQCYQALGPGPSGYVESADLKRVLLSSDQEDHHSEASVDEGVNEIMTKLDVNGDRKVSEQEFYIVFGNFKKALQCEARFQRLLDNVLQSCQEGNTADVLKGLALKEKASSTVGSAKNP